MHFFNRRKSIKSSFKNFKTCLKTPPNVENHSSEACFSDIMDALKTVGSRTIDAIGDAVQHPTDVLGNIQHAMGQFDLETENFNGLFTNTTLLTMLLVSLTGQRKLLKGKHNHDTKKVYDYIIVGGGTAGSVMANRLSSKPCVNVLLLEAGGSPPLLTEVPSFSRIFYRSHIDWQYRIAPQKYSCFGQINNSIIWNSGKCLGGGSVLNAMMYVRGNKRNYDDWEAEGCEGWSYKDVLPYFLKLENNRDIEDLDEGYHQVGGPLTAERIEYTPKIKPSIMDAAQDMGYEFVDANGVRQTGFFDAQGTLRKRQRCSTAKAYLEPAEKRPNLDILPKAFGRKIIMDGNTAIGVEFDHKGEIYTVLARKEVVISNGATRTPQILMLSGIGPKEQLDKFEIPVVVDLPGVGKNLQDHYAASLMYSLKSSIIPVVVKNILPTSILDYIFFRKGPCTAPCQITLLAFLDGLNTTANSVDFPSHELFFAEYGVIDAKHNMNLKPEIYKKVFAPYTLHPMYLCYSQLLQPKSRGEITLNSLDPHDYPNIDPNYYSDPEDLKSVVEGMKVCNAIARHPHMEKVKAKLIHHMDTGFPGCEEFEGDEDKYLGCIALAMVSTIWHPSGTARMGKVGDPRSVVDPEARVIGVKNLRVANAAIFPYIPSGNTNVPTIMVAEKIADMMINGFKCDGE